MEQHDIIIIGAGVTGCACARELARWKADILVLEKGEDVCTGTSKANSAIVHTGYDAAHGSLMARLNVEGSRRMETLAEELDVPYRRNGSMVVCLAQEDMPRLQALYENGIQNGVEGLAILTGEQAREKEPHLSPKVTAALWAPTGGIVCPFGLTIALAENAHANGVAFRFDTAVSGLQRTEKGWLVHTDAGTFAARCVVNAAGLYADSLHNMVSARHIHITPRRGEYLLLDRETGGFVNSTVFQLPGKYGKGVLVTPTVHGNTLVGPTSCDIEDKQDTATTAAGLAEVAQKAALALEGLPLRQVITSFCGLRAHEDGHEFVIGTPQDAPGFIDAAGIESPGLSASPAIGAHVAALAAQMLGLEQKPDFLATRKGILDPFTLPPQQYARLVGQQPAYGRIVCRCENVTEGQILDAIRRPLGARTLDGVKRRTRAGMGRCQAGFCTPRVMQLLAQELHIPLDAVTKRGPGSNLTVGENKDRWQEGQRQ